jgi:uncharacterized protein YndB with AHSA1/START domain
VTSLTVVRRIRARPEVVFEILTTPKGMMQWWAPDSGPVLLAEAEPNVGGHFRVRFRRDLDGSEYETNGEFLEFVPCRRVVMSWWWTAGTADPGVSRVEITLRKITGGTEVTVFHDRLDNDETRLSHQEGWIFALSRVDSAATRI